jgi:hypothetical protein
MKNNLKELSKIIDDLGVVPKLFLKKNDYGEMTFRGIYLGQEVLVKIVPKIFKKRADRFRKEFKVDSIISRQGQTEGQIIEVIHTKKIGETDHFVWLMRDFIQGKTLCLPQKNRKKFPYVKNVDTFYPEFVDSRDSIIEGISRNLKNLQKINPAIIKKERFKPRFSFDLKSSAKAIEKELKISLANPVNYYQRIKSNFSDQRNLVASSGDLTPANIIISEKGRVYFSDFEWFCLDNYCQDLAFLYLFLYRYPAWQKMLLSKKIRSKKDREMFQAGMIRGIIGYMSHTLVYKIGLPGYKNHIWMKYLQASSESYDAINKISQ